MDKSWSDEGYGRRSVTRRELLQTVAAAGVGVAVSRVLPRGATEQSGTVLAATPRRGGTLNVGLHIPLPHLDWQSTVAHPFPHVLGNVFEGLTAWGKDFTAVPELAQSINVSVDSKVWTFTLWKGVLFHSGKELTAADVQASLERWRRVGPKGTVLKSLDRYEIADKYVLRLHFKEPVGSSLLLAFGSDENKAVILPKEVAEASPEAGKLSEVIGTGPYQLTEYKADQVVRLKRFEKYVPRGARPNYQGGRKATYLDEIVFWIVPEPTTRIAGLQTGEYDVITDLPDTDFDRLKRAPGVVPVKNGPGALNYMMFNHKAGPTSNLEIRKAIQAALDAKELTAVVVSDPGFGVADPSFFPPESPYHNDACAELYGKGNIAKAKEHLATARYKDEPITLQAIATNPANVRLMTAAAEQMRRAGINAVVARYDIATWRARRRSASALNIYSSTGYWFDPILYEPEFNGTFPSEEVAFRSSETDEVFRKLARESQLKNRVALARELQCLFYQKVATINLGYIYRLVARREYVMDPEDNLSRGNLTLNNVWLNK